MDNIEIIPDNTLKKKKHIEIKRYGLFTFCAGVIISLMFFLPFIIMGGGLFTSFGDYNAQQIPFYTHVHDMVRSGNFGWDYYTDLGSNVIGGYSFYAFGSPFFWLTIPFPSDWVAYMLPYLMMLKLGFAALGGYVFLKRYTKEKKNAVLGGLLYAFSGYTLITLVFNHFLEPILIFPFMLAALDAFMIDKKKGFFALTVFISCTMNYVFFIGQAAFILIYYIIRLISKDYVFKLREFIFLFFESLLGTGAALFIFLPSINMALTNSRATQTSEEWNLWLYANVQRYASIVQSYIFPADLSLHPALTKNMDDSWHSISQYVPLFGTIGLFAAFQNKKNKFIRIMFPLTVVMAFIPLLNSIFSAFNAEYYARWFYMAVLIQVLALVIALSDENVNFKKAAIQNLVLTGILVLPLVFTPTWRAGDDGEAYKGLCLTQYLEPFLVFIGIAAVSAVAALMIFKLYKNHKGMFYRVSALALAVIVIGNYFYYINYSRNESGNVNINVIDTEAIESGKNLPNVLSTLESKEETENEFYRFDYYRHNFNEDYDKKETYENKCMVENIGMYWKTAPLQDFNSVVAGSVMNFYQAISCPRPKLANVPPKLYGLRGLLSVKYMADLDNDGGDYNGEMPGFEDVAQNGKYSIYENKDYIPMGFTYDYSASSDQLTDACAMKEDGTTASVGEISGGEELTNDSHLLLLKAMVLDEEDAEANSDILKPIDSVDNMDFSAEQYEKDCADRRAISCSSFERDNNGFTAKITTKDSDELVFFSVPYDDGWSAKVNNADAKIIRANVGFMAVRVPAGTESNIRFDYNTPGLSYGIYVSSICIAVMALYLFAAVYTDKKAKKAAVKANEESTTDKGSDNDA